MAKPPSLIPRASLQPVLSSGPPPAHPGVRWTQGPGWFVLIAGLYCLHVARPSQHAIDSFFAVNRSLYWDESFRVAALALCFVAFALGAAAAGVRLTETRNKYWSPPIGALALAAVALIALLVAMLRV